MPLIKCSTQCHVFSEGKKKIMITTLSRNEMSLITSIRVDDEDELSTLV